MTIYIDNDNKCHVSNDVSRIPYVTNYFDGKCAAYIEGYCCKISDSFVSYYPWRDFALLCEFQAQYEAQLAAAAAAYAEGVNSI